MNWDPTIHHMLPGSTPFVGLRILRHPAALPVSMFRIMTIDPYWNGYNMTTPKIEKLSEICENSCVRYGLSSMQGWRTTMEDVIKNRSTVTSINDSVKCDTLLEWPNNGFINVIVKDQSLVHIINRANGLVEPIELIVFRIKLL